jgi:hypothetical protein
MRTVTFKSVLHGVAVRLGMDPTTGLNVVDARAITEYIRTAFRYAWTFGPWPQTTRTEERTPDADRLIDFAQDDELVIETIFGVYKNDPATATNPMEIKGCRIGRDGITVPMGSPATVWVAFREPPPEWTCEIPATGATMAAGATYYDPADGLCREVLVEFESGTDTPVEGTDVRTMEFPAFLAEAVKCGAHALAMQEEGQFATALLPADAMDSQLQHEWAVVERQQGMVTTIGTQPR